MKPSIDCTVCLECQHAAIAAIDLFFTALDARRRQLLHGSSRIATAAAMNMNIAAIIKFCTGTDINASTTLAHDLNWDFLQEKKESIMALVSTHKVHCAWERMGNSPVQECHPTSLPRI